MFCSFLQIADSQVKMTYKDGRVFSVDEPIQLKDTIEFVNYDGQTDWFFLLEMREDKSAGIEDGELAQINVCKNSTQYEMNVASIDIDWAGATGHFMDDDKRKIYKGYIVRKRFDMWNPVCDSIPLLFCLAPTKPVILEKEFKYDLFYPEDFHFVNRVSNFKVYSEGGVTALYCSHTKYDPRDEEFEPDFFGITDYTAVLPNDNNVYELSCSWGWRQYITIIASNKYGYSFHSDTLFTCDEIKDKCIEDAWKATTVMTPKTDFEFIFKIQNNNIVLNEKAQSIDFFDISGRLMLSVDNTKMYNISSLKKGWYIVRIRKGQHCFIKKIRI